MLIRGNVFFKSGIYQIFNRGPYLFRTHEQYSRCKDLIYQYSIDYQISIIAYCLMPNYYHFLLQQNGDTPISKLIGSVFNQYVQYVNHLNSRKGPLFESRFKHILVEKDEYLQVLCRYIHLNPVSAGIISNVEDWAYSDYFDWAFGKSLYVYEYFSSGEDYVDFVYQNQKSLPVRFTFD